MDLIMTKRVTLSCSPLLPQSASQTILIVECNEKGIKGSDHHRLIGGILMVIESAQNTKKIQVYIKQSYVKLVSLLKLQKMCTT